MEGRGAHKGLQGVSIEKHILWLHRNNIIL